LVAAGETLFGTTSAGAGGAGTIFKVDETTGQEQVIHRYNSDQDGKTPYAGLLYENGILYGTTNQSGPFDCGTVFSFNTKSNTFAVLHSFNCGAGGANPYAGVISLGRAIFGTALNGGRQGDGAVFKINLTTGRDRLVHSFSFFVDGSSPVGGLVHLNGYLYGTAASGGSNGRGTIVQIDPATGSDIVLHAFNQNGGNGAGPQAALTVVGGLLYSTSLGGEFGQGDVFRINPNSGGYTELHSFAGGAEGAYPEAGLVYHGGELYGTTKQGGGTGCENAGCGTIYKIRP
jgi:uncharacterized repeat protein (TIGR03803 family)